LTGFDSAELIDMTLPCDLCGEQDSLDTPGDPTGKVRICSGCGFVHVKERRGIEAVAKAWDEIYASGQYSPDWPGVKARLFYVAEWLDQTIGLKGKSVLDIGAGNGEFLLRAAHRGAGHLCGLDPSRKNCNLILQKGIEACNAWVSPGSRPLGKFDIVTLNWTLENTADCIAVLKYARDCVNPGGHVVVSTGSRILVPFKKPLSFYLGSGTPPDTHCFRWCPPHLGRAARLAGLYSARSDSPTAGCPPMKGGMATNDWNENDALIMVFSATDVGCTEKLPSATQVHNFFSDWQRAWP
jgi:2-polyprenyl-6-hydroxyphenyl methylase/3-demethylubiquinone-9 3-methyltransferase